MHKQSMQRTALATVLLLVAMVLQAQPAQADPIPPTQWTPTSTVVSRTLLTHSDGGVTGGCGYGTPVTAFWSLNVSGQQTQSLTNTGGYYGDMCNNTGVVGKDGTVVVWMYHQWTPTIQAYKNNSLVWSLAQCSPQAMTVGADGNVYLVVSGSGVCAGQRLIGVTLTAAAGTTLPQIVLSVPVSGYILPHGLAAYADGLVLRREHSVQYISLQGEAGEPMAFTSAPHYGNFAATTSGRVFYATKAGQGATLGCSYPSVVAGTIAAVDPSGSAWSSSLEPCTQVYEIRPTPSGGVVLRTKYQEVTGGSLQDRLVAYDKYGAELWRKYFAGAGGDLYLTDLQFAVDLNGNVAVQYGRMVQQGYRFPEVQFMLLQGNLGTVVAGTELALKGDSSTSSGPSYMWVSDIAIGNDAYYLTAYQCTTWPNGCNTASTTLYAFTVPGLEMDYPRGALLRHDLPWKSYVALGDSFSSGEGVEPFVVGTDTSSNRCHRSEKAYARLLDGTPGKRLNLQEFRACSGATTERVTTPWPQGPNDGEDPQVSGLNFGTAVVTISLGGNDVGFKDFVTQCLFWDCSNPAANQAFFNEIANNLYGKLHGAYSEIATEAPNAQVYVVGYPQLLPEFGCPQTDDWMVAFNQLVADARGGNGAAMTAVYAIGYAAELTTEQIGAFIASGVLEFSSSEAATARLLTQRLNEKIAATVQAMNNVQQNPRFHFVDPTVAGSPFFGHELCTSQPYFNGLDAVNQSYSFHPNANGQLHMLNY